MTSGASAEPFAFNGVDGASGQYLTPSLTQHDVANLAQGKPLTQPDAPVNTCACRRAGGTSPERACLAP